MIGNPMAARHTNMSQRILRVAKISAQLGREDAGLYVTLDKIAQDALQLVALGDEARRLITAGTSAERPYAAARRIAADYMAATVERGDVRGMVLGIRFTSSRFSSGSDHVLYVS